MKWRYFVISLGGCVLFALAFGLWETGSRTQLSRSSLSRGERLSAGEVNPCAIVLAPHKGNEAIDREIRDLQGKVRANPEHADTIKRLGRAFVTKARLSYDPGYYKIGEQCSLCVRLKKGEDPDALLLCCSKCSREIPASSSQQLTKKGKYENHTVGARSRENQSGATSAILCPSRNQSIQSHGCTPYNS
jgi:hypothetical protein